MKITELPTEGYEKVVHCVDSESGLSAIISVHDTTLGPALGGLRMWPYLSVQEALTDVNRLSEGMTFKSAVARTGLGGGKSIIIGNPKTDKSEALFRAMGRFIETLGGLYTTAEDVGTSVEDCVIVRKETRYVTGLPLEMGSSGDPSPFTAKGTFVGQRACIEKVLGTSDFKGVRVAVQGAGHVAKYLCDHLAGAGAEIYITDIVKEKAQAIAEKHGATMVAPEEIYDVKCEIYAPCALGATVNDDTIPRLQCKIIAGAANNSLLTQEHGESLRERGILYAPDFVINAGGIINVSVELERDGYNEPRAMEKVNNIYGAVKDIIETAERENIPTSRAAILRAQQIIAEGHKQKEAGA